MDSHAFFNKIQPMLAVTAEPFDSEEYLFEVKWDGFRCLSLHEPGHTFLKSRNNRSFDQKFPELAGIHENMGRQSVILDGEIIIMDQGTPSFYQLQKRGWAQDEETIKRNAKIKPATYIAFDIISLGNEDLTQMPLEKRRELLKEIIRQDDRIYVSEAMTGQGKAFFQICAERNLEGVIAKKIDSLYMPGKRSAEWKKIKKSLEGDFIICGFKQTVRETARLDALILGIYLEKKLVFQGAVGVGLGGSMGEIVYQLVSSLKRETPLFPVPQDINKGIQWIAPLVCCSVQYLEPSKEGGLRHPVFRGVREDLQPHACTGISGSHPYEPNEEKGDGN